MAAPVALATATLAALAATSVARAATTTTPPATTTTAATTTPQPAPGGPLSRSNPTPFPLSSTILSAQWTSGRYDPPANQWGDILPTIWSHDGGTYVMMDDGGVDVPLSGGVWRQSVARITGSPPNLSFQNVTGANSPAPHTLAEASANPETDDGPLGPYYSMGFTEVGGVFYATQARNWDWGTNAPFTGLAGIAYSRNGGTTWTSAGRPFPAPLGNLTFLDGGARGGAYPDGYVYAIGTEREFNATRLLLGRVRPGVANITDPARWQWFVGTGTGSKRPPKWSSSLSAAVPVINWGSHITYPQMTYDAPLHRYLLTFTYSYSSQLPNVWSGGAELVILEAPTPSGPFSFVARSTQFGPSNGYGAGIPSQWISRDGRDLWLKWAANFAGCAKGLDCSGKYGFNLAKVHLTTKPVAPHRSRLPGHLRVLYTLSGVSVPLLVAFAFGRRRRRATRDALRRRPRTEQRPPRPR
jgi:hypothetical protein